VRVIFIPPIVGAGALASRLLLARAPHALAADLAQPLPVVTSWGPFGLALWGVLAVTLLLAFVPYAAALRRAPSLQATIAVALASVLAGFAWLPLFSSDVYAYAAYGEMARMGLDPYVHHVLPLGDPLLAPAQWQWSSHGQHGLPICVYGAAFVALARTIAAIADGTNVALALALFRVVSCAALLLCALLAYAAAAGDAIAKRRAAFFIGCNPLALWAAIEGHNDTLMLAIVLAGLALARYERIAGVFVTALGALVKLPALAFSAAFALQSVFTKDRPLRALAGFALGACVAVAGSLALVHGVRSDLAPHARYAPFASVQALGIPVALAAAALVLARAAAFRSGIDRWSAIALAAWLAIPNPYPWYALWIVPLGAFAHDTRVTAAVLTVGTASLLRYLPDAVAAPAPSVSIVLGVLALAAYTPLFAKSADRLRLQPRGRGWL
jgi:hypothetical protein